MNPPTLRIYQHQSVESVFEEWKTKTSTMIVIPTGGGKTVCFCEVARRLLPQRCIIVAHRSELIDQAVSALNRIGLRAEVEMGDKKSDASMFHNESTIVASVQSLNSGKKDDKRMAKFDPNHFACLIIDEAHHSVAPSYRAVIEHFRKNPNLKILLVTATPRRADDKALGLVCDSVAYEYKIVDAIKDGYLVPIEQQIVHIKSIDLSHVRTTAGDLNGADLAQVMEDEKNLQGMVGASIQIIGKRSSIAFTSSVRHAEMCCDIFNRHRSGMADWICGDTPGEERAATIRKFKAGEVQVLCNVGICTEGTDLPNAEVAIMGRPTKSAALFQQMTGRILRPLPGIIDGLNSAFERNEAIAESAKPSALVLDFCGNSGKHKLVSCADLLGGDYSEEVRDLAVANVSESGSAVRMADALRKADEKIRQRIEDQKRAEAARKAKLIAQVQFSCRNISPFDVLQITPRKDTGWDSGRPLSEKQKDILRKIGVNPDEIGAPACRQLLKKHFERREQGLCTISQAKVLHRYGIDARKVTFVEASRLIDQIKENGWKSPAQMEFA